MGNPLDLLLAAEGENLPHQRGRAMSGPSNTALK